MTQQTKDWIQFNYDSRKDSGSTHLIDVRIDGFYHNLYPVPLDGDVHILCDRYRSIGAEVLGVWNLNKPFEDQLRQLESGESVFNY